MGLSCPKLTMQVLLNQGEAEVKLP